MKFIIFNNKNCFVSLLFLFLLFSINLIYADSDNELFLPLDNEQQENIIINPKSSKTALPLNYNKALKNRRAKNAWLEGNYHNAEKEFRNNAIENPNEGLLRYNLGTSLYKNENMEEAQKEFELSLNDKDFQYRDRAFHNLGNIAYKSGDYEQALENYRKALRENPDNLEARKNFEMTRLMLQQQQNAGGESDDKEDEDQEQQEQQQQQQNQDDNDQQQQKQQQQQEMNPDKQQAEQLLKALEQKQEQAKKENETDQSGALKGKFW